MPVQPSLRGCSTSTCERAEAPPTLVGGRKPTSGRQSTEAFTWWLQMLVSNDSFNCPIGNVTFEPGARNNWHKHPGGQILLVTDGKGYYQEEGKPVRVLHAGDVVQIPPDVKHWHGTAPDSWSVHLTIIANPKEGDAEWLEHVTEEEYRRLK